MILSLIKPILIVPNRTSLSNISSRLSFKSSDKFEHGSFDEFNYLNLSAAEQKRQRQIIEAKYVVLKAKYDKIDKNSPMSAEERKILAEFEKSKQEMVCVFQLFAKKIARSYANRIKTDFLNNYENFTSAGIIGLCNATEKFNPSLGISFSTYATFHIKSRIIHEINNSAFNVRIGNNYYSKLKEIYEAKMKLEARLQRLPTDEELAKELKMPLKKLKSLLKTEKTMRMKNLEKLQFADEKNVDPKETIENRELVDIIFKIINSTLSQEEQKVLLSHAYSKDTLETLAEDMNLSRERVRQKEKKALFKVRLKLPTSLLKEYKKAYATDAKKEKTDKLNNDKIQSMLISLDIEPPDVERTKLLLLLFSDKAIDILVEHYDLNNNNGQAHKTSSVNKKTLNNIIEVLKEGLTNYTKE